MNVKLFSISLLTAGVLLASASPASASGYTFTVLDTLGGRMGWGAGEVTGINNFGQVVGWSNISGDSAFHAAIWNGTTPTDLGTLGGDYSRAMGINDSGQVVGWANTSDSKIHATIWNGTTPTDLGLGQATGINDSGQVVGWANTSDSKIHVTIWNGTTPTDLGTLRGGYSEAFGINDSGQVVGSSGNFNWESPFYSHATIWNGTTPTDLNNFLSVSDIHAGWVLLSATSINDNSAIIGMAINLFNFDLSRPYLLTPCDTCPINDYDHIAPHVPEPEIYAMFMAGLGLMGFIARRRKNGQA